MGGVQPQLIGDIGFGELVVIAFVAVLVFGPDKLPVLAKQAGAMARRLRDFATSARDEVRSEGRQRVAARADSASAASAIQLVAALRCGQGIEPDEDDPVGGGAKLDE